MGQADFKKRQLNNSHHSGTWHRLSVNNNLTEYLQQDARNGIFTGCLMCPHLFPLYVSQIFKTILPSQLKELNSFIQKDCVIFYRCVTGNHTGDYYLITSCLSVTFPLRIEVLKLSNKAWFLLQELSNFHRFNCRMLLRSYSLNLPLQKG